MKSFLLFFLIIILQSNAQTIIPYKGDATSLEQRWDWAIKTAESSKNTNYWIVYTFERMMPENNTIGHYDWGDNPGSTLGHLLYPNRPMDYIKSIRGNSFHNSSKNVLKEIALLYEIENKKVIQVEMSTIDLFFKLKGLSVYWLGIVQEKESMDKIVKTYNEVKSMDAKETLISAAGMHNSVPESFYFFKNIVNSDEKNELREDAVFWTGQLDNPQALSFLKDVALSDRDEDVAEKAIFALQEMESEEATDAIIYIIKNADNREVREKAVFWLGQIASEMAVDKLDDIAFSDDETAIQKQAVFALAQLEDGRGIPKLIKIANTHPNPKIRKNAIFWLGESNDDRALQALIDLVQN